MVHFKLTASFIILNACHLTRTLVKSAYPKINFLISHPKQILWVLNYFSIKLLVHYQVQLSFSHTACPLSSATIFQSYCLSTVKCNYLSVILLVHCQVNYLSVILLVHCQVNYLSIKLLVHCQVQLSFSHTTCPLSSELSFSHTTCPLSSELSFN